MSKIRNNKPINCAGVQANLNAFVDDHLLDNDTSAVVQQHLALCAACRSEEAALRRLTACLRQMPRPDPPESLRRRLMAQVQAERETNAAGHFDVLITRMEERQGREHFFCEWREVKSYPVEPAPATMAVPGHNDRRHWTHGSFDTLHCTQID